MKQLIDGYQKYQSSVFQSQAELFKKLAGGQAPETLFITCSDSRIQPDVLTQTKPGELFIIRNAGNIVPPHGAATGGEGATVEFAVAALGVKEIIVCGHSHCGAMKGLLNPKSLESLPAVAQWLQHAEATRRIVQENHPDASPDKLLALATQENVLMQIENLRTHPAVAARLARGELELFGWVYKFETGEVFAYDAGQGTFVPLAEACTGSIPNSLKRTAEAVV